MNVTICVKDRVKEREREREGLQTKQNKKYVTNLQVLLLF